MLKNKNIILGISGSIAAIKSAKIIDLLLKAGANVEVIFTKNGENFANIKEIEQIIGADKVYKEEDLFREGQEMLHIDLAKRADYILIAPASCNIIAKIANGFADNLLTTVILASRADLIVVPAMNQQMWNNRFTQINIKKLKDNEVIFIGPAEGLQACGDYGYGRMTEPEQIITIITLIAASSYGGFSDTHVHKKYNPLLEPCTPSDQSKLQIVMKGGLKTLAKEDLKGLKILINAGPTIEKIDPIRYISNFSSGKMGYALAELARRRGAEVTLVTGPANIPKPSDVTIEQVESTNEMYLSTMKHIKNVDIFIACAAIADYSPSHYCSQKIKKNENDLSLKLKQNPDIVKQVTKLEDRPFTVCFAAETENLQENAKIKLQSKNVDMLVANNVSDGQVFSQDFSEVYIFYKHQENSLHIPSNNKEYIADKILDEILKNYNINH